MVKFEQFSVFFWHFWAILGPTGLVSGCFQVVLGISIDFHADICKIQVISGDTNLFLRVFRGIFLIF